MNTSKNFYTISGNKVFAVDTPSPPRSLSLWTKRRVAFLCFTLDYNGGCLVFKRYIELYSRLRNIPHLWSFNLYDLEIYMKSENFWQFSQQPPFFPDDVSFFHRFDNPNKFFCLLLIFLIFRSNVIAAFHFIFVIEILQYYFLRQTENLIILYHSKI